ncbi:hypothetical protein PE067_06530 [Paracoccus sp. DMF-8]|nr:hypothetical protein [Paracoccus sp. DMF-8]MDF3605832.1 hypothetical protein [Paracoccus sp. DMF-8]
MLKDTAEIDNATANLMTVSELTGATARAETRRALPQAYLDAISGARSSW